MTTMRDENISEILEFVDALPADDQDQFLELLRAVRTTPRAAVKLRGIRAAGITDLGVAAAVVREKKTIEAALFNGSAFSK